MQGPLTAFGLIIRITYFPVFRDRDENFQEGDLERSISRYLDRENETDRVLDLLTIFETLDISLDPFVSFFHLLQGTLLIFDFLGRY